jgi:hypothetical protein
VRPLKSCELRRVSGTMPLCRMLTSSRSRKLNEPRCRGGVGTQPYIGVLGSELPSY